MKLSLMRHVQAERGERMDGDRQLTEKGKKQGKQMAAFAKQMGLEPDFIICSDFVRASDTADMMEKSIGGKIVKTNKLDPNDDPENAINAITKLAGKAKEVLVISHHPLVNKMLATLVGGKGAGRFHFEHGAIAHLNTSDKKGKIRWLSTPETVGALNSEKSMEQTKRWIATPDSCPLCSNNEALGPIPVTEDFGTIDKTLKTKAHDTCECTIEYSKVY